MEIKIYRMAKVVKESNVKAFIDVIIDNDLIVKGFRLVEGKEGMFLANPSEKGTDNKYFDTARFANDETKKTVEKLAIEKFKAKE